jgi:hypothetical protein
VIEIKNPPTKVGGKQFGWIKQSLVLSASANAERLYNKWEELRMEKTFYKGAIPVMK